MSLDALLAKLEGRPATADTPDVGVTLQPKPAPVLACTPATADTSLNGEPGAKLRTDVAANDDRRVSPASPESRPRIYGSCSRWRVHFANRAPIEVTFAPAVTHDEALAYRDAIAAEPILERPEPPASCSTCRHSTKFWNCGTPVEAGLASKFMLIPNSAVGAGCKAFDAKQLPIESRLTELLALGAIDTDDAVLCRERYATDSAAWDLLLACCERAMKDTRR